MYIIELEYETIIKILQNNLIFIKRKAKVSRDQPTELYKEKLLS